MSSILEGRMFYNSRMAKRGGLYLAGSLVAAAAAGLFSAAARHAPRMAPLGLSPTAALGGFVALCLLAAALWWRFSSLQDEMFHRIQNYSYGWGATLAIFIVIVWSVANAAGFAAPIPALAPLLVFACTKFFFWTVATRKWL